MAIVTISESTATPDEYDRFQEAMNQAGAPKPLVHIAGPIEGGRAGHQCGLRKKTWTPW
jgi:hypothetical protein